MGKQTASSTLTESQTEDTTLLLRPDDTTPTSLSWTKLPLLRQNATPINPSKSLSKARHLPHLLLAHRTACYAAIPLVGATLWTSMMLYFLYYYLTLPRLHGTLPRIGFAYSTFPYISCIGAVRLPYFQTFCIAVATTNTLSFALDLHLTASIRTARRWRWAKSSASWISSVFLILLSYYSVNANDQLHLDFTSIQILSTGLARTVDGLQQITLLRASPGNPYIERPNIIKKIAAFIAGPSSLVAVIGIYGCRNPLQTLKRETTCYKLVTIAAPAEWTLSVSWVIYMFAIAMDLYYVDKVKENFWLLYNHRGRKVGGVELFSH
jgi:Frag1/DRAM/Sfk1 family